MNIGFIGAGKAGFTLGKYFRTHGIEVTGYYSRSIRSAREAAAFTSSNVYEDAAGVLSKSDVLFLTVPDGSIRPTYEALAPLFLGNARSVAATGARDALTGPVERGDLGTLRAHLASLGAREDQLLYLLLTAKLLPLAGARHPERDDSSIKEFLKAETARRLGKG